MPHACDAHAQRLGAQEALKILPPLRLQDLDNLVQSLVDSHVARRLIYLAAPCKVLFTLLLHLDVEQAQRVHARAPVNGDSVHERIRLPRVCKEADRDGLPEVVELEAASGAGVHDRGIVDHADLDSPALGPESDVRVCGRTIHIANHKESHLLPGGPLKHLLTLRLDSLPVHERDGALVKLLKALDVDSEDGRVPLKVDCLAASDCLKSLDSDILLIPEPEPHKIEASLPRHSADEVREDSVE
mmetsp:Transcript_45837/g.111643  ORF Transcript_45837/g.111643 Transcript_45837/m.111643 type:complete len:244 (+) Transcript_45837:165-896(+)